jgi:hypothetical protein
VPYTNRGRGGGLVMMRVVESTVGSGRSERVVREEEEIRVKF